MMSAKNQSHLPQVEPRRAAAGAPAGGGAFIARSQQSDRHRDLATSNRKPRYRRLKQMEGPDERLCNGTVRLSMII
jgi:hypothetical protein